MSEEKQVAPPDPEFFPENVEFLGFIGSWHCDLGVDTVENLFYLIRTNDLDWLEVVVRYSEKVISKSCVMSVPREESKLEAAAQLLDAYIRARVHYEVPVPPCRRGLLTTDELANIVAAVADELERNSRAAQKEQAQNEAPIIKMARELSLNPRPAGHNKTAWMADCPHGSHWIMISPSANEFGCGYCRRKGGPKELKEFWDSAGNPDSRDKVR